MGKRSHSEKLAKMRAALVSKHERQEQTRQRQVERMNAMHAEEREFDKRELEFLDGQIDEAVAFEQSEKAALTEEVAQ